MSLTPEDIIKILNECKGHVKSLEINGKSIKVEFLVPQQPKEQLPSTHNQGQSLPITVEEISDEKNLVKDLVEGRDPATVETEDLIDEIALTEPGKYEALIALGEIERAVEKNYDR